MAKTVKKPISVVRAVTRVCGWRVRVYQEDRSDNGSPHAMVLVDTFEDAERPYGSYWLRASDTGNSLCLFVNPHPLNTDDQLLTGHRGLKNAFSVVSVAYKGAGHDGDDGLAAVESVLVSSGLLDPAFA